MGCSLKINVRILWFTIVHIALTRYDLDFPLILALLLLNVKTSQTRRGWGRGGGRAWNLNLPPLICPRSRHRSCCCYNIRTFFVSMKTFFSFIYRPVSFECAWRIPDRLVGGAEHCVPRALFSTNRSIIRIYIFFFFETITIISIFIGTNLVLLLL